MKTEPDARVGKAMWSGGVGVGCSKQSMPLLKGAAATQFQLTVSSWDVDPVLADPLIFQEKL